MRTLSPGQLVSRSAAELGVLHDMFNKAMARSKPFSAEWLQCAASIHAIQTERRGRIERPWRGAA